VGLARSKKNNHQIELSSHVDGVDHDHDGHYPGEDGVLESISPTFYAQLLRQNPFAKKLQTQIVST
jgi:hypothetical protein